MPGGRTCRESKEEGSRGSQGAEENEVSRPFLTMAIVVLGWTLLIPEAGKTMPKGCRECGATLDALAMGESEFRSKAECPKAGFDFIRDFYATARKNGEQVAVAPSKPQCLEVPPR